MTMDIKQIAVGDDVSHVNQVMIDSMADVTFRAFQEVFASLDSQGLIDQKSDNKILQPRAAVIGCYIGLLRIMSLDGRIDPHRAFDHLNLELTKIITTSRIGIPGEDDIEAMIAEVEKAAGKFVH